MVIGPECHKEGIKGFGNPDYGVMIIGIAPGFEEAKAGKPFVGPSGKLLDAVLKGSHFPRENVYCTNLVCTVHNEPSKEQIGACAPRLAKEILELKPKLIIALGKTPAQALNFPEKRGDILWDETYDAYVMWTYHPAAVLRGNTYFINDIIRDIRKIPIVVGWNESPSLVNYTVVSDSVLVNDFLNRCYNNQTVVAVDIETTSPSTEDYDPYVDNLLCLSVSDGNETYVVPRSVADSIVWPDCRYLFHNGLFDVNGIWKYLGVKLNIAEDTMLMSYSIDERGGYHGLKVLTKEYFATGEYEGEVKKFRRRGFQSVPDEILYEYNAKDAAYTARLLPVLRKLQQDEKTEDLYRNILIPAANTFVDIKKRGVFIDQHACKELFMEWAPFYLDGEAKLQEEAKENGFLGDINLNSPKQLSYYLYDILHLPGGPSTSAKALEGVEHPFVKAMLEWRRYDHFISTYLMGIQDDIRDDSRVHANVMLHGTVTGRLAYHEPPLQTIPKPTKVGDNFGRIRRIFAATNDDYEIVECDYKTIEVYMAAAISQDPNMLLDLQKDFHRQAAAQIFHLKPEEVSDLLRDRSKYVTFGILYNRQAEALAAAELDCEVYIAQQYIDNWFERYNVYYNWFLKTREQAKKTGIITSPTGRKRRFRLVMGEDSWRALNQAVNFPIQSVASDNTLLSAIELNPLLKEYDSYILFLVHDSIVFEVSKKYHSEAISLIKSVMTKSHVYGFPGVPIDISVGQNWYEVKKIKC